MLLAAARRSCSRALALPGAATGAGALSVVAVRRPRQPWRRWSWCRLPGCSVSGSPTCSGAARRPGEVSAPGLAVLLGPCAGWLPPVAWLWRGGAPPLAVSPAHRSRSRLQATPATSLPQPPPEKKAPWKPTGARCRRCRAGSRGWFPWPSGWTAVLAVRDTERYASAAYPVCCGSGPVRSSPG